MATLRDDPYGQFNFQVDFGGSDPAGFAEVHGLAASVDVIEYRSGNSRSNHSTKLPGLARTGNVTLRRGVIGSLDLFEWFARSAAGAVDRRDVTIELLNEDRSEVAVVFRLRRAWPASYAAGPLLASGTDVAIEELVLACESIDVQ